MQHLVTKFDVYRITFADDSVGGAEATSSLTYKNIRGTMLIRPPSQLLLEQGLETPRVADVIIRPRPGTATLYERDQLLVTGPPGHPNLNERWRIESVQQPDMHPKNRRTFFKLRCTRIDRTRTESAVV